ncbi:N-acetylmannosamine-6-phosphate 2-epimerase, partial [Mycoplasmopsis synoviae]
TPELARKAHLLNSDAVVVGSAITRPQFITKQFKDIIFKDA